MSGRAVLQGPVSLLLGLQLTSDSHCLGSLWGEKAVVALPHAKQPGQQAEVSRKN